MPHYRIDLRAHSLDSSFFEDYLVIFKDWISQFQKYSYSIEDDDTIDRHLHCYLVADIPTSDKVKRQLMRNNFNPLMKTMKNCTQTTENNFFHIESVNKTPLKALGYTQKFTCKRKDYKGFTKQDIIDALEYYYTCEKHDKKHILDKTSWRLVTLRNFHGIVEEYVEKHNLDYKCSSLIERMKSDKFSFLNVPIKQIKRGFQELRLAHKQSCEQDKIDAHWEFDGIEDKESFHYEEITKLSIFISNLAKNKIIEPEDISEDIKEIIWRYREN